MFLKKIAPILIVIISVHGAGAATAWNRNLTIRTEPTEQMVFGTWILDKKLLKDERLQKTFVSKFRRAVVVPESLYAGSEFITEDFSDITKELAEIIVEEFTIAETSIREKMHIGKQQEFRIKLSVDRIQNMTVIRAEGNQYFGYFIPINPNYILRYLPTSCGDRIEGFYRK